MNHLPDPHPETLAAAAGALERLPLPWPARWALPAFGETRRTLARAAARAVEDAARRLLASQLAALDRPGWSLPLAAAQTLILHGGAGPGDGEWFSRLPASSGLVPAGACRKCGAAGLPVRARYVRQVAGRGGEFLVRVCGCGFEWRERCADAPEPQNGLQGDETGPCGVVGAQAVTGAHSTPQETALAPSGLGGES